MKEHGSFIVQDPFLKAVPTSSCHTVLTVVPDQWEDRETDCGVRNVPQLWSVAEDSMKPVLLPSHALSVRTSNNHQVNID